MNEKKPTTWPETIGIIAIVLLLVLFCGWGMWLLAGVVN